MRVNSPLLERIHLDPAYALLSMQNIMTAMQIFGLLDVHAQKCLNDVIFEFFVIGFTDMTVAQVPVLFSLLDVDQSGEIEFDEFYLLFCMLIACKDQYEKEFIYRHSKSIFQLIDTDDSGQISRQEFANMGILFNFDRKSVLSIFNEFDISGDKQLDFREFRLFTMACIDEQRIIDAHKKVNAFREYNHRLVNNLAPTVKRYIQSHNLPPPIEIEAAVDATTPPYIIRRYYYPGPKELLVRFLRKALATLKRWFAPICRYFAACKTYFRCRKKDNDLADILSLSDFPTTEEKRKCCGRPVNCCCWRRKRISIDFTPRNAGKPVAGFDRNSIVSVSPSIRASVRRGLRKSTVLMDANKLDLNSALARVSYVPKDVAKIQQGVRRSTVFQVKRFD